MEEEKTLPEEENLTPEEEKAKSFLQIQKESWYDKIPLSLKQLDGIIALCWIALLVTAILIYLDVKDIFHLFG